MPRHPFIAFSALAAGLPALASAQPIAADDSRLAGFATSVAEFSPSTPDSLSPEVSSPSAALGAPDSGSTGAPDFLPVGLVSLGDAPVGTASGSITLGFDQAITNGAGADFAIFENASDFTNFGSGIFAELAFVEVSTDGNTFARFATSSLTTFPDPNGNALDTDLQLDFSGNQDFATLPSRSLVSGFAGADPAFNGTLFDLSALSSVAEVLAGTVDLDLINFVRLIDIAGDGRTTDSNGNPIFDAFSPNNATGGFDLDAVGVLNAVPEPTTAALLSLAGLSLLRRRRA